MRSTRVESFAEYQVLTVAALFVEEGGIYYHIPNVDPWPISRDARKYDGPYPVVAHPPCERWGRMYKGGLRKHLYNNGEGKRLGDDNGCLKSAIESVREYGGVLEHPEGSHAWEAFGIQRPGKSSEWIEADPWGYTACVDQGNYGHRARKFTWLYAVVSNKKDLPILASGDSGKKGRIMFPYPTAVVKGKDPNLFLVTPEEKTSTPMAFASLLIYIATISKIKTIPSSGRFG